MEKKERSQERPPDSSPWPLLQVGIPVVEGAIAQISGVALCAVVPVYEASRSSYVDMLAYRNSFLCMWTACVT